MYNPESKWIHHLMVAAILAIFALTFYTFLQVQSEFSGYVAANGKSGDQTQDFQVFKKYKFITITELMLCIVLILCVWFTATSSSSKRLLQLSQVLTDMRNQNLNEKINITSTGALGVLEESIEKLREEINLNDPKRETNDHNDLPYSKNIAQKLIQLALGESPENLFPYLGDAIAQLKPLHKYYLFQVAPDSETITCEPFISQHSNQELLLHKTGVSLISSIHEKNDPFLWKKFIESFIPKSAEDRSDMEYLQRIEKSLNPVMAFPLPGLDNKKYLLLTDLNPEIAEHIKHIEILKQMVLIYSRNILKSNEETKLKAAGYNQILNFRDFLNQAQTKIKSARKAKQPVTFVLIAVDFYSTIIETYGSVISQQLIDKLTDLIFVNSKDSDQIGKFSNEVFIIMVCDYTSSEIYEYSEKYRKLVESQIFRFGSNELRVTVSIGAASVHHDLKEGEEFLLKRTRSMLDKAITGGGNRSCFDGK